MRFWNQMSNQLLHLHLLELLKNQRKDATYPIRLTQLLYQNTGYCCILFLACCFLFTLFHFLVILWTIVYFLTTTGYSINVEPKCIQLYVKFWCLFFQCFFFTCQKCLLVHRNRLIHYGVRVTCTCIITFKITSLLHQLLMQCWCTEQTPYLD